MQSAALYIITVLIWGSTWLAIEFQLGEVPAELSLLYRFALAAVLMWGYCLYKALPMRVKLKDHFYLMLLAACNFAFNYLFLYWAQQYLTSAMSSIAFSTLLVMNIINSRLFFAKPVTGRVMIGALLGLAGIVALFWQDIKSLDFATGSMLGLGLALTGTLLASFGNMTSVRNSQHNIGILQGNAWGMFYASVLLLALALFNQTPFIFDSQLPYVLSLIYLSVFGTVIAFACYFALLKDIGPDKASYAVVLFPLVAVVLSMLFEGFVWHLHTAIGFILVISGNVLVLTPLEKIRDFFSVNKAR